MYKLYLFLLLSFIFFSANSYAYDEDYILEKDICKLEDRSSCKNISFECNIKSTSKDKDNFEIEISKVAYPKNRPVRKCECTEESSDLLRTSFLCYCQGNIPASMNCCFFGWRLLGTKVQTCNHFIHKLYQNDFPVIKKDFRLEAY